MNPHLYKEIGYNISVKIALEYLEEYIVIMEYFVSKIREEEGNIFYYVLLDHNCNEEGEFLYWGLWKDAEAVHIHMESKYFQTYVPQLGQMCERFTVIELDRFL